MKTKALLIGMIAVLSACTQVMVVVVPYYERTEPPRPAYCDMSPQWATCCVACERMHEFRCDQFPGRCEGACLDSGFGPDVAKATSRKEIERAVTAHFNGEPHTCER